MTASLQYPATDPDAALEFALTQLRNKFAERAAEHDRDGSFPIENFASLHEFGLLSLTVPRELGGGGANLAATARVIREVARAEPSTALVLIMQYLFHLGIVQGSRWPKRVREIVQLDAVRNGALINALRVEPELGTPAIKERLFEAKGMECIPSGASM